MTDNHIQATQSPQPALEFEPSDLVEYGTVADLTQNNVGGAIIDGAQYS